MGRPLYGGHNRQPFRFIFEYYRPDDEWRVFSLSLDDDIEDAARKALLPP